MVIVKLISGLGNQLFQYAVGRQIALNRNVPLKLDTSFFSSQNLRSYKLHHYNIAAEVAMEAEIQGLTSKRLDKRILRKAEKLLPKHKRHYYPEAEPWTYEADLLQASSSVYLDGYWQHYKYFEKINSVLLDELTVKDDTTEVAPLLTELQQNPSSVSLHLRRGDYVTDPQARNLMGLLPLDYYRAAVSRITASVKDANFYIFSDDLQWAKDNLRIDAPMKCVDAACGRKDYLELELMRHCKHNIIANSSFSWWGAFLNRNKQKMVVMPAQWVASPTANKRIELGFPSWIKL